MGILLVYDVTDLKSFQSKFQLFLSKLLKLALHKNFKAMRRL